MAAPRSTATKRARKAAARHASGRASGRRGDPLLPWSIALFVAVYVVLFGAAIAGSAGGAVVASLLSIAWAAVGCGVAARLGRGPQLGGGLLLLGVQLALMSPTATHWAAGRTRSGPLDFGSADPTTVQAAQTLGWVGLAILAVGAPVSWALARRTERRRHEA